jgi:hypothetical protein
MLNTSNAIRVDEYTASGTYRRISPPGGANYLTILAFGGGGGGQGGGARNTAVETTGGGGGGGGGTALVSFDLRYFPNQFVLRKPMVLEVIVGAGGAGGAGRNTAGLGNGGSTGGTTSVNLTLTNDTNLMRLAWAAGGLPGSGSGGQRNGVGGEGMMMGGLSRNTSLGIRGQDGGGTPGWSSGGFRFPRQWSTSSYDIPSIPYICGGGGSGGVINADGVSRQTGGSGGTGYFWYEAYLGADGGTGAGRDATLYDMIFAGCGGGGGYSAVIADNANAFNGGNGIRGGGGGGGGGIYMSASPGTYSSGAGGTGGTGYCMLLWTP